MFDRVDYSAAVMLAGLLLGLLWSRRLARLPASIVARAYFAIVLVFLGLRLLCFLGSVIHPQTNIWHIAGGASSDSLALCFGALFGIALRRADGSALFSHPSIFSALCIAEAFSFALINLGKAFSMDWMIHFFHQSGYSTTFFKCIMITEVFAALAMLIPATVLPAVCVLAVDMFGAIYTHIHNGDPLNDSTDAIVALFHLAVIAILWNLRTGTAEKRRIPYTVIAAGAVVCRLVAILGGMLMRQTVPPG